MFRHNLSIAARSFKVLPNKSCIGACSLFHTGQPLYKYKQVDYDGTKARDADIAEKARLVTQLQNSSTEPKVNYFSWKGIMQLRTKAMDAMKKYGVVFVCSYAALYLSMAGTYFVLLDNGLVSTSMVGVDQTETAMKFAKVLDNLFNDPSIPAYVENNPRVSTAVVALALSEVSEPIRLGMLWVLVPKISKALGRVP